MAQSETLEFPPIKLPEPPTEDQRRLSLIEQIGETGSVVPRAEVERIIRNYLVQLSGSGALIDTSDVSVSFDVSYAPVPALERVNLMGLDFSDLEARALARDAALISGVPREQAFGRLYRASHLDAAAAQFYQTTEWPVIDYSAPVLTSCYGNPTRLHSGSSFSLEFALPDDMSEAFASWFDTPERPTERVEDFLASSPAPEASRPSTAILGALSAHETTDKICTWVQKPLDAETALGHKQNTGAAFHPPQPRSPTNARRIRDQASGPLPRSGGRQHW